ncbi:hypothetical protein Chor_017173 [Crotalus horridus]
MPSQDSLGSYQDETKTDFTWIVKANNRAYHAQIQKRHLWCLKKRKYADNAIKTAKYNVFTFLPLNLYEQFHRLANVYFLLIILLQTFPQISTLPWFSLLFPLAILLSIRGIRDLIDDVARHRSDGEINNRPCEILTGGRMEYHLLDKYGDLHGIAKRSKLEQADLLLLSSSEPNSLCYVETMDIDGETNLKYRQALLVTHQQLTCMENMAAFDGEVVCEEPNSRLHNFVGILEWHGEKYPLDYEKILLRGCRIRFDTKIMKNCGKIKLKKTKLCHLMDRLVLLVKALYCSRFEFIYLVNSCFINWDTEMYYAEKDTPAKARSTSLNDQLGQIEYIFSDKTGTLTQNIMTFKKCCISGTIYGSSNKSECSSMDLSWNKYIDKKLVFHDQLLLDTIRRDQDPILREYMRLLALCHTVMVEEKESELVYQAASPDEEALVTAARNLGYVFLSRTQDSITISELGIQRTYKVLALLDFNSVRKRMSILETHNCPLPQSFAAETLRTLCLAMKELDKKEYTLWKKKHHAASILLQGRAQGLDTVYEEIEQNLKLLGATAIEDKLQDGVPETIHLLKRGDIKVWVLTGDKQETAVNIGFACHLLSEDMTILKESEIRKSDPWVVSLGFICPQEKIFHTEEDKKAKKKKGLLEYLRFRTADTSKDCRRLIEKAFVELATTCQAVICCRVTPKQKALIVQMVKRHKNAISLAIGDGANDVNMIKTADIGVGISGQEGMQAVQCSDYALAQFHYLQRLLFVHGKWSYLRIAKFLRHFFFKTFAGMMVQIWFAFYTGFTAQPLLESWFLALYNVVYTSIPDMNDKKSLQFPELYKAGQKDLFFNFGIFFVSFIHGSFVSLANFYITMWAMGDRSGTRVTGDYQSFGMIVATSAILTVMAEMMLEMKFWTLVSFLAILISLGLYCLLTYITQSFQAFNISPQMFPYPEATRNALTDPTAVLVILLCIVVNIIPSLAVRFVYSTISPPTMSEMFQVQEIQKKPSTVELTSHNSRNSLLRHSSYAFSHKEGYAHLISKGASLRSKGVPIRSQLNDFHSTHSPGKESPLLTQINADPKKVSAEQKAQLS